MFSKPLAYSSALDHRLASLPASYVEELWSPILDRSRTMCTLKRTHYFLRHCSAERRVIFLSQAGPQFVLGLLQAEHHLWFLRCRRLQNNEGDPVGVALDWLGNAARG
jgi:hypothetical protein